jgi:5-methylcytosine-specific restriction endonuclease McrA
MSIRAEGRISRRWARQTVLTEDPPVSSPAAMVLLVRKYFLLDKTIFSERRMLHIRTRWMKEQVKSSRILFHSSKLRCKICGRGGLDPFTQDKNKLATLDHIVELDKGGSWNDPSNFQVACYRCNGRKSATPPKCR